MEPEQPNEDAMRERQDGGYEVPILAEPAGGPIPQWTGDDPEEEDDEE